jgi:hypothetical protein
MQKDLWQIDQHRGLTKQSQFRQSDACGWGLLCSGPVCSTADSECRPARLAFRRALRAVISA